MNGSEQSFLERFARSQIKNSILSNKAPNYGPDYWKKLLIGGLPLPGADKVFLNTRQLFCYCLFGPAGCGQRNLALAFAGDCQRAGYKAYDVPGQVLRGENMMDTYNRVEEAFAVATAAPSVLLIENPGDFTVWECILSACERLDLREPLKLVVTEEDETVLSDSLKSVFFLCRFELPDEEDRARFFEKYLPLAGSDEPSPAGMANAATGLSYDDLVQLVNLLRLQLKANGLKQYLAAKKRGLSEEELAGEMAGLRESGEICLTMDLFEDSLVMIRQQKLAAKRERRDGSLHVVLEGGIPVATGYAPGLAGAPTGFVPGMPSGDIPKATVSGDEDLEEKSRSKVLEDLNKRFERRGGEV